MVVVGTVVDSDAADEAPVSLLFSGELVDSDTGRVWSVSFLSSGFSEVALLVSLLGCLLTAASSRFAAAAVVGAPRPEAPRVNAGCLDLLGRDGRPRSELSRLDARELDADAPDGVAVLVV